MVDPTGKSLPVVDRLAIHDLLNLHGHLCDTGAFARFREIMSEDVIYDASDLGGEVLRGLDQCTAASVALGTKNPIAHLVTNIVCGPETEDGVEVVSKGLGLTASGTLGAVTYQDHLERTPDGWRISHRRVLARREPLSPYRLP